MHAVGGGDHQPCNGPALRAPDAVGEESLREPADRPYAFGECGHGGLGPKSLSALSEAEPAPGEDSAEEEKGAGLGESAQADPLAQSNTTVSPGSCRRATSLASSTDRRRLRAKLSSPSTRTTAKWRLTVMRPSDLAAWLAMISVTWS